MNAGKSDMKSRFFRVFSCLIVFFLLSACEAAGDRSGGTEEAETVSFFAMDTYMEFRVYGEAGDGAREIVQEIERRVSVTDPDSEIARLNHRETDTVSPETAELLETALDLCRFSGGALDISIYPVVRAWGFTERELEAGKRYPVPSVAETDALIQRVDYAKILLDGDRVTLPEEMEIDLGGIAKGYAGREAAAYLRRQGVQSALLNLGGNVQTVGAKPDGSPWRVAVQDPELGGYAGIVEIVDRAAVTSGGYQRYFTGTHIMDPSTGRPARNGLISATVVAEDGALCDALSTALFVMGPEKAEAFWRQRGDRDFGMVLITEDGEILVTPDLSFTPDPLSGYTARILDPV